MSSGHASGYAGIRRLFEGIYPGRTSMNAAGSLVNVFLIFLAVAGVLVLVNGLIDVGFQSLRSHIESMLHYPGRAVTRQKAKTASLPPR